MIGILNSVEMFELLSKQFIGHLGCHADDVTLVEPISYAYVDGEIFCHTSEGMKIGMMRKNKNVCFQVEEIANQQNWKSVICQCEYIEISAISEKKKAVKYLLDRDIPYFKSQTVMLSSTWPFHDDETEQLSGLFFKLKIRSLTGRFENFKTIKEEQYKIGD